MSQLTVSLFNDRSGSGITALPVSWADFVANFSAPPIVGSKAECQLFSLCEFGEKRTENGSLRSNDNVLGVWGAVGDYDGEKVKPWEAVAALGAAGVRALVYTSPSHTPDAPRWRVVAPFSGRLGAEDQAAAVERLNTIVGGGLSSESFTLSQPYYIGRVAGSEAYFDAVATEGATIDARPDIPRTPWRGARAENGTYRVSAETLLDDLRSGIEIHPAIVALAARGYTQDELTDIVQKHCAAWDRPERGRVAIEQDIPRAVSSWERKKTRDLERMLASIGTPPVPAPPIKPPGWLVKVGSLTRSPRPLNWLVRDIIEHPSFVVMFGPPEQGKSLLAMDMACCVALGLPWRGKKTKRARVVYLAGEGHNGIGRRMLAWKIANGVSDADWEAADLYVSPTAINMNDGEAMRRFYDEVTTLGTPELLFIDTLTRMTPGTDQSSQREIGEFIRHCDDMVRTWNCTVVVLHHTGQGDNTRAMGSIALKGAVDVEMRVIKTTGGVVELSNTKAKEADKFPPQFFKFREVVLPWLESDTDPNEVPRAQKSAVFETCEPPVKGGGQANKNVTLLREVLREGPLSETEARRRFKGLHETGGEAARKAFDRALEGATTAGVVIFNEDTGTYRLVLSDIQ